MSEPTKLRGLAAFLPAISIFGVLGGAIVGWHPSGGAWREIARADNVFVGAVLGLLFVLPFRVIIGLSLSNKILQFTLTNLFELTVIAALFSALAANCFQIIRDSPQIFYDAGPFSNWLQDQVRRSF